MKIKLRVISIFAIYKLIILKTLYCFFYFFLQQMHQLNHHNSDLNSTVDLLRSSIHCTVYIIIF